MLDRTRRFLLVLCGQTTGAMLSVLALWLAAGWQSHPDQWLYRAAPTMLLIRLLYRLSRGPLPVLITRSITKRAWRMLLDESVIAMALLAITWLAAWPVERDTMAVWFGVNLGFQSIFLATVRALLQRLAAETRRGHNHVLRRQAVIIGAGAQAKAVADKILDSPEMDTYIVGFLDYHREGLWRYRDIPLIGGPEQLPKIIATCQVDAVIIAVETEDLARTQPVFEVAEQMGVAVCLMSDIFRSRLARVRPGYINGIPTLVYRAVSDNLAAIWAKSLLDRLGALVGIVLTAPIMLAATIWIKLDSKGPILFRQTRSGLNGRPFTMYKFRTMVADAEQLKEALRKQNEMSGPVFKIKNDPRITRAGRILRRLSIDELPQFFNVLMGHMSLVGPRPPLPKEVVEYDPWHHRRLSVKPGLTCLWQISGRNKVDFEDWMKLDLEYIDTWSLWQDVKIIARTVPAVLKSEGAS